MTIIPQDANASTPGNVGYRHEPAHPPGQYVQIPLSVLSDKSLSHPAICLYGVMLAAGTSTSAELARATDQSERNVRNLIAELIARNLVIKKSTMTAEEAKNFLCTHKCPSTLNPPTWVSYFCRCHWCASETVILHDHHWPVPRVDGGTETVAICAGCHAEYHFLCRDTYQAVSCSTEGSLNE